MADTPLARLQQYPGNPRRGDVAAIAASLEANGQYRPVVVQKSTGYVLAGNHTVQAAESLGWSEVAAVVLDVDDDRAARIVLADNRTADLARYDDGALLHLLNDLDDLDGTGYDDHDLEALTHLAEPLDLDNLLDQVGEPQEHDAWRRVVIHLPPDLAVSLERTLGSDPVPVVEAWLSA